MRADSKPQKLEMLRLVGVERLDMVVRNRDCPEEEGLYQTIQLGEVQMWVSKQGKKVPERLIAVRLFARYRMEWEGYRTSGKSVYHPSHAEYTYFQVMAGMNASRLYFLELMAVNLSTDGGLEWGWSGAISCCSWTSISSWSTWSRDPASMLACMTPMRMPTTER